MSTVANFVLKLSSDGTNLSSGITGAQKQLTNFYRTVAGSAIAVYTKRVIDNASAIVDLSRKTGIATDTLQAWTYAARQNGADIETVSNSFKHLQKSIVEAIGGNAGKLAAFQRMGIDIGRLKSMKPDDLFEAVAKHIGSTGASAQITSDALEIMGKTGDAMLPAFRDGFAAAAEEARKMGQVIDTETLAALDAAGDKVDQLAGRFQTVLAPAIGFVLDKLRDLSDFLEITVGGGAAYLGALSAGASEKEAKEIAYATADKVLDKRISDNAKNAATAAGLNAPPLAPGGSGSVDKTPKTTKQAEGFSGGNAIASDQLAKIGLFRGGTNESVPLLRRIVNKQDQTVTELRQINTQLSEDAD